MDTREIAVGVIITIAFALIVQFYSRYNTQSIYYMDTVAPYSPAYYEQLNDKIFRKFIFQSGLVGGAALTLSVIILLTRKEY